MFAEWVAYRSSYVRNDRLLIAFSQPETQGRKHDGAENCNSVRGRVVTRELRPCRRHLPRPPRLRRLRLSRRQRDQSVSHKGLVSQTIALKLRPKSKSLAELGPRSNGNAKSHHEVDDAFVEDFFVLAEFVDRAVIGPPSHPFRLRREVPFLGIKPADSA